MPKAFPEWMRLQVWLCSSRIVVWGEGLVEGAVFSLIALGLWSMHWE